MALERGALTSLTKFGNNSITTNRVPLGMDLQEKFGFSFVTGVPPTPEATEELSTRIGFIRETQCMYTQLNK